MGGESAGNRSAVKVWDMRQFKDYDDQVELGTRNFKVALRRLRRFARQGADMELDLDDTIASTARNAGHLDLRMVPERHNTVKVLMLLDVGGSMDDHIGRVEELFSAARSEFRNLEVYYFHNCPYESLWQSNRRRQNERFDTWDVLRKYNPDWRLIIVGDATMSPYEILQPGGSVEHYNKEPGAEWVRRLLEAWPKSVWLNPEPRRPGSTASPSPCCATSCRAACTRSPSPAWNRPCASCQSRMGAAREFLSKHSHLKRAQPIASAVNHPPAAPASPASAGRTPGPASVRT